MEDEVLISDSMQLGELPSLPYSWLLELEILGNSEQWKIN